MHRAVTLAAASALAVALLVGCGSDPDEKAATLPPATATPSPSPSPTSTEGMYDKQQIKYVYKQLNDGYNAAQTMPKKKRRKYLGQWMVDPALSTFVTTMAKDAKHHRRTFGKTIPHIFEVTIDGDTAHLDDCADESRTVFKNTKTGEVIVEGKKHVWLTADLVKTGDGWRVKFAASKEKSCADRLTYS